MNNIVYALDKTQNYDDLKNTFKKYKGLLHSIKVHSVYHQAGSDNLCVLSDRYKVPLFYDLKIYDTPNTTYETIKNLPKQVKYITVTYAYSNEDSIKAAKEAAVDYNKNIFIVSALTSSKIYYGTRIEIYSSTCKVVNNLNKIYELKPMGVVVPCDFIQITKKYYDLTTLTPGLTTQTCSTDYTNQIYTGSILEAKISGGDVFVLGRNMPETVSELITLQEELRNV